MVFSFYGGHPPKPIQGIRFYDNGGRLIPEFNDGEGVVLNLMRRYGFSIFTFQSQILYFDFGFSRFHFVSGRIVVD